MLYHPRIFNEAADANKPKPRTRSLSPATSMPAGRRVPSRRARPLLPRQRRPCKADRSRARTSGSRSGESVLIFDYPGYGKRARARRARRAVTTAAESAYQWLVKEQKIPPARIIIYGESLGGAVAVDLASKQPHGALVLERTFTSAPDVADYQMPLFPGYWLMSNRFDSLAKIPQCRRPIFLAAADKDKLIPFQQAEQLKRACSAPSQLYVLKGLGHNDPLPSDYYAALRTFLATNANLGWTEPTSLGS